MTIRNWSSSVCSTVLTLSLQDLLEERGRAEAALDLVTATRRYWEDDASVRVDDLARQQIDREGIWLSGWLRARTGVTRSEERRVGKEGVSKWRIRGAPSH